MAVNVSQEQMWATGVTAASFVAQATAGRHDSEIDDEEDLQVTQSSCPATAVSAKRPNVSGTPRSPEVANKSAMASVRHASCRSFQ